MKVALIHDYLNQYGGAERVLEVLLELFPKAHVYTLLYSKEKTLGRFHKNIHKTSFLDFPFTRARHRPFIPIMPLAAKTLTVGGNYDLVISDTAGYAKGVTIRHRYSKEQNGFNNPYHISYCHTPLRYAWETENYFENELLKAAGAPIFKYLKNWDKEAAQKPDVLLANSKFIAGKIKNFYERDAQVVYPPVDTKKFYYDDDHNYDNGKGYYLAVGRFLHYKKFDLIIEAFSELNLPLKIVGAGPEIENLKSQISNLKNIEIIPFISDEKLRNLYQGAKALIFPQVEDFGLTAAEAQSCGTPVIAYAAGGALEIVKDGITGIFFYRQDSEDLISAVRRFHRMKFDRRKISKLSQRFGKENFKKGILESIPKHLLEIGNQ